ncbi:hypothetical protein TRIUR3_07334 [Triticum urartu]|uniref:Uncharacterized protein n=1 Tax=Triticum urartu TaxID=4572 RepID=M7Y8E1_TRIUA|nr:hypothetical protein TRIUR3_07334 [Triticum urartu]
MSFSSLENSHSAVRQSLHTQTSVEQTVKDPEIEGEMPYTAAGDQGRHPLLTPGEHQDGDLEDFKRDAAALAQENNELKIKLKEAESCAELSEPITDPEHSGRDLRAEIRKLKKAYKALSSQKESEVSALLAEKDFVWNQYKTMEKDYETLLKKKKMEAAQATEAAEKLQRKVEELQLQVVAQKKDDDVGRLQAEANDAKKKVLALEDKLQKMHSLVSEKDDEIQKLKSGHLQSSQKRKKDISGTHRRSRSEGPSVRGKSKGNPRRQMAEEDQPETSQKRQCASSLSSKQDRTYHSYGTNQVLIYVLILGTGAPALLLEDDAPETRVVVITCASAAAVRPP